MLNCKNSLKQYRVQLKVGEHAMNRLLVLVFLALSARGLASAQARTAKAATPPGAGCGVRRAICNSLLANRKRLVMLLNCTLHA